MQVRKLKTQLANLHVYHGDCHDQNIVFDVPAHRQQILRIGDRKARKRALMRYIAMGPSGPARLVFIDFGESRKLSGAVGKLCILACGAGERFAGAEMGHDDAEHEGLAPLEALLPAAELVAHFD